MCLYFCVPFSGNVNTKKGCKNKIPVWQILWLMMNSCKVYISNERKEERKGKNETKNKAKERLRGVTSRPLSTHHSHEQLVKPLQLEFSAGPHVRPEGRLHQTHTATGQQLSGRPGHVAGIVHLPGKKCSCV